jgi:hypothetical protein
MANVKITCPSCHKKHKIADNRHIFLCSECGFPVIHDTTPKERFKLLKKITSSEEKSEARIRQENLQAIRTGVRNLHNRINEHLENGKYKDAELDLSQLFLIDNTSIEKYWYLFLLELGVSSSVDAYEAFRKKGQKKQEQIMRSGTFQLLHHDERYQALLDSILLHTYYQKLPEEERISLSNRGVE